VYVCDESERQPAVVNSKRTKREKKQEKRNDTNNKEIKRKQVKLSPAGRLLRLTTPLHTTHHNTQQTRKHTGEGKNKQRERRNQTKDDIRMRVQTTRVSGSTKENFVKEGRPNEREREKENQREQQQTAQRTTTEAAM